MIKINKLKIETAKKEPVIYRNMIRSLNNTVPVAVTLRNNSLVINVNGTQYLITIDSIVKEVMKEHEHSLL